MDPRTVHKLEQAGADVRENAAPALYQMYEAFKQSGFDDVMAFDLTKAFLVSSMNSGFNKNAGQLKRLVNVVKVLVEEVRKNSIDSDTVGVLEALWNVLTELEGGLR